MERMETAKNIYKRLEEQGLPIDSMLVYYTRDSDESKEAYLNTLGEAFRKQRGKLQEATFGVAEVKFNDINEIKFEVIEPPRKLIGFKDVYCISIEEGTLDVFPSSGNKYHYTGEISSENKEKIEQVMEEFNFEHSKTERNMLERILDHFRFLTT
jgi:hypothetical protein